MMLKIQARTHVITVSAQFTPHGKHALTTRLGEANEMLWANANRQNVLSIQESRGRCEITPKCKV
jgi:hypothetical protein